LEQGDPRFGKPYGQAYLAKMLFAGIGGSQDLVEASQWAAKAADQGNDVGELLLGEMSEFGIGAKQDPVEALNWYRKAAAQNNADASAGVARLEQQVKTK
jgi:uncharacterized protein